MIEITLFFDTLFEDIELFRTKMIQKSLPRFIVMGSSIADRVFAGLARTPWVISTSIKGKLENLPSRISDSLPEILHRFIQSTEVFSNDRKILSSFEEFFSRAPDPLSIPGCLLSIRNRIIIRKATEMINTKNIEDGEVMVNPLMEPGIVIFLPIVPILDRVTP